MSKAESRFEGFLSRLGVPAWGIEVLGILWLIADLFGRFDFWLSVTSRVGGTAEILTYFLTQPAFPIILMFVGAYILWNITDPRLHIDDRKALSTTSWIIMAILVTPLCSMALFVDFVTSSKIPEAIAFAEKGMTERHVDEDQYNDLYSALRKLPQPFPAFEVASSHDPEALQYATELMRVFYASGLKLTNGEAGSSFPVPTDIFTPSARGIMIAVKNAAAPPQNALALVEAFHAAKLETRLISVGSRGPDEIMLLVGGK